VKNINFENITPQSIIEFANSKPVGHYKNIIPTEIYKSHSGEIIILEGNKNRYMNLIDFWLSVQSWYSDGSENLGKNLYFDDLSLYKFWQNDKNRVGQCILANNQERILYNQRLAFHFNKFVPKEYLIMDSNWNDFKILFTDQSCYYVYYFWTGN